MYTIFPLEASLKCSLFWQSLPLDQDVEGTKVRLETPRNMLHATSLVFFKHVLMNEWMNEWAILIPFTAKAYACHTNKREHHGFHYSIFRELFCYEQQYFCMLPENYKFSLFKLLFSIIIVVTQGEKRSCPLLWNSKPAWVSKGHERVWWRNRWQWPALLCFLPQHGIKDPCTVLLRECVEAFDNNLVCFILNESHSDIGLLLRGFESFGPQHLFIAGCPNINEQKLCFTSLSSPHPLEAPHSAFRFSKSYPDVRSCREPLFPPLFVSTH